MKKGEKVANKLDKRIGVFVRVHAHDPSFLRVKFKSNIETWSRDFIIPITTKKLSKGV